MSQIILPHLNNSYSIPKSRFRNSVNAYILAGLFYESYVAGQEVLHMYSVRDYDITKPDGTVLPSLYLLYMSENDPTEYVFANKYLGGWEHWTRLCETSFFKPYITRWREELKLRVKAEALQKLFAISRDPEHRNHTEVNKFLVQHGYLDKAEKGRPSRAEVTKAAKAKAEEIFNLSEDYTRIFGVSTNGSN